MSQDSNRRLRSLKDGLEDKNMVETINEGGSITFKMVLEKLENGQITVEEAEAIMKKCYTLDRWEKTRTCKFADMYVALTPSAENRVIAYLVSNMNYATNLVKTTQAKMSKDLNISLISVKRVIRDLKRVGFIAVPSHSGGYIRVNPYLICRGTVDFEKYMRACWDSDVNDLDLDGPDTSRLHKSKTPRLSEIIKSEKESD